MPLPQPVADSITRAGPRAILIMLAIWLLLMLISLHRDSVAHAHDAQHLSNWIGNQAYTSPNAEACCGLDCVMLDDDAIKPAPGGYAVHGSGTYFLRDAPHDVRRERFDESLPASATLVSQDNRYWLCGTYYAEFTGPNQRRCFFIKPAFSAAPLVNRGAG